jgi:hypothetical protein
MPIVESVPPYQPITPHVLGCSLLQPLVVGHFIVGAITTTTVTATINKMDREHANGVYEALISASRQIHLLRLEPRLENAVRCRMYIFELRRCPSFKALSYTWGSQMQPQFCFESRPYPTVYLPSDISSNLG